MHDAPMNIEYDLVETIAKYIAFSTFFEQLKSVSPERCK